MPKEGLSGGISTPGLSVRDHDQSSDDGGSFFHTPYGDPFDEQEKQTYLTKSWILSSLLVFLVTFMVAMYLFTLTTAAGLLGATAHEAEEESFSRISTVPDYFQTSPQIYAGPTATGAAPFLAQTNPVPFGGLKSYVANSPLQTAIPIVGNSNESNVFELMGQLSPYFSGPGFGSNEYPIPPGADISQVHVLHRHGSRYPTGDSSVPSFGHKIFDLTKNGSAEWSGELNFLNAWKYELGAEILVARGRQELFDSGVLHYYNYGRLYNQSSKIVARTTTQDRMLKSAEYFMAGFFGLDWTSNVTLEVQIEQPNFNTSLAGYFQCPNSENSRAMGGNNASIIWSNIYLANATQRLRALSGNYNWTVADSYDAQTLCPYETVAYGYSAFCGLFTYEEWQGFEYSIDLQFYGGVGFGSPVGRSVGIGYVQEVYARLQNHLYDLEEGATNVNYTLATMNSTFPLNQTLYFDFSHDTNIMSILTAFGLKQFAQDLPATSMPANRSAIVSHITPFGARVDFEIIRAPQPVKAIRPTTHNAAMAEYYDAGEATTYIHLTISQRTVPLYQSYPECGRRDDGWCTLDTFIDQLNRTLTAARFEYSCFANYTAVPYGEITDGKLKRVNFWRLNGANQ